MCQGIANGLFLNLVHQVTSTQRVQIRITLEHEPLNLPCIQNTQDFLVHQFFFNGRLLSVSRVFPESFKQEDGLLFAGSVVLLGLYRHTSGATAEHLDSVTK